MSAPQRCRPPSNATEPLLGEVDLYHPMDKVAEVRLLGILRRGQCLHVVRQLSDWYQTAEELRLNGSTVEEAGPEQTVSFMVLEPVIRGDCVYAVHAAGSGPGPGGPAPKEPPEEPEGPPEPEGPSPQKPEPEPEKPLEPEKPPESEEPPEPETEPNEPQPEKPPENPGPTGTPTVVPPLPPEHPADPDGPALPSSGWPSRRTPPKRDGFGN